MKKLISIAAIIFLMVNAFGQNADKKWSVGVIVGKPEYVGDLGNGFLDFVPHYATIGLSGARYLTPSFDLALQVEYGDYGYFQDWTTNFLANMVNGSLLLKYKLNNGYLLLEKARIAPFLAVGAGLAVFSQGRDLDVRPGIRTLSGTDPILPIGGGIRFNIIPALSLQYQLLFNLTGSDDRDLVTEGGNDHFFNHTVGLFVNLGSSKTDSDLDGVPDKLDKCPNTPIGVAVTPDGCPVDRDGDGIPDYQDECPDVKGLPAFKGCPDRDGDGIPDHLDECPDVKGLPAFKGCPDSDGDGIPDAEDRCPDAPGPKELRGCPDSDGDGIPDIDDKCPTVAGIIENKGCPPVKEEEKKVFDEALRGIHFEIDRDMIKAVSYPILDNVVSVMRNNPQYNLEINGHTDSTGSDEHNLDLSQRRARAVREYLVGKGIDPGRLTSNGFGESKPVAPNDTEEGRALNRRVEFKVIF
ncbi:MAG: OmpA family protein [Bacteroidales bacterium]